MKENLTVKNVIIAVGVCILAGIGWFFWQKQTSAIPDGFLTAGGRIEGREVNVSSKVMGRIIALQADEGDTVKTGQVLAVLDSEQIQAQVNAARENVKLAQRQQEQAEFDLAYAGKTSDAAIWAARAAVDKAQAQLTKAQAVEKTAERNYQRYRQLYEDGAVPATSYDSRKLEYDSSNADAAAAGQVYEAAQANLATAESSAVAVEIKKKQLEASQANLYSLQAKLQELQANLQELQVKAPLDGTIITRPVEIGQVVNAVSPFFVMVDLNKIYMKIYIPEQQIGKVQLGNETRIYVDAYPERYFSGKVTKISDQAEFTPKNVETKEERVKLVFAVEVAVENPDSLLKPGMPGDVVLRWEEDLPWIKIK